MDASVVFGEFAFLNVQCERLNIAQTECPPGVWWGHNEGVMSSIHHRVGPGPSSLFLITALHQDMMDQQV